MANNIELLIDLGVEKESSRKNINSYIKQLKSLETVKVELEISGIKSYQDTIKKLQSQLSNTNLNINAGGSSKGFKDITTDSIKARNEVGKLNNEIAKSKRTTDGFIGAFTNALTKFPVWMAASSVFYQTTAGVTDLIQKVIELDTALTNMRRVLDLPDHRFNEILETSIVNVDKLSGRLSGYLELVTEFGRTGYSDLEALDLADTAQTLANISDLTPSESVSSLIAAMTAFNIEAENSVQIADKLNEVKC